MSYLSLDTNIFLIAHFSKKEKDRGKCDNLIFSRSFDPVMTKSVKNEFLFVLNKTVGYFEDLIMLVDSGKSFAKAEKQIKKDKKIFTNKKMLVGINELGFSVSEINNIASKRNDFLLKLNEKINSVKQSFFADISDFDFEDADFKREIKPILIKLKPKFDSINSSYNKIIIHRPDNEHWVRSANYSKEVVFVTNDYFGLKNNKYKIVKNKVEKEVNSLIKGNFIFRFLY